MVRKTVGIACSCVLVAGCGTTGTAPGLMSPAKFGPGALSLNDARAFNEKKTLPIRPESTDLAKLIHSELDIGNGAGSGPVTPAEYTAAGYNYVYRQCNNYFDSLILLQNESGFSGDLIVASGSALGTILGLARASSVAIGAIAATTGFATATVNSYNSRALMTPYPNETKSLIISALDSYRAKFPPNSISDAPEAILNVQHFAELCTYSGITRAAKQALATASGTVQQVGKGDVSVLVAAITAQLGAPDTLKPRQLAALYGYVLDDNNFKTSAFTAAIEKDLPAEVIKKLKDTDGRYADPKTTLRPLLGDELTQLYKADSDFKAAADAYPNDAPAVAGAPTPGGAGGAGKAGGAAGGPKAASVPTTATTRSLTVQSERFGHVDYSKVPPPPPPE